MLKLLHGFYNMDTNFVELTYSDGSVLTIDCEEVENFYNVTNSQMADLDWLVYHAPMELCRAGGIWRTGAPPKGNCASRNRRLTWQKAGVSRLVLDTPTFLFHAKSTVIESQCRSFHVARYEKHGQKSSLAMISVRIFCLSGHWGWYAKPYWVMAYSISSGSNASLVCPSE